MLYVVGKFLQEFIYPLNLVLLLGAVALVQQVRGKRRMAGIAMAAAMLLLLVASTPVFVDPFLLGLESFAPSRPISEYPSAGAIVLLGGSVNPTRPPRHEPEELGGNRVLPAARLYRHGKAKLVLVSGGLAYPDKDGEPRTEADDMAELLVDMGVPSMAILKESESRNTYENAVLSAKLLKERGIREILLVTSALHQRRAAALFRAQGLEVVPVPNSFSAAPPIRGDLRQWTPSPHTLSKSTALLKEVVGYIAYRLLGKL